MFLIWGEQNTEKKLGYVAEYCATCRDIRTVKLLRVGRVSHLYYVPLGQGRLLGYDGVCRNCELRFGVEISDYPAFEQDKDSELVALVRKTNPKLLAGNDAAVAAWRRMTEIREPFVRYNLNLLQRYIGRTRFDLHSGLALAGAFVLPAVFVVVTSLLALPKSADSWLGFGMIAIFFGGLIATNRLLKSAPQRYFHQRLEEAMLEDVRRARPTREELAECMAGLREHGYPIAEAISIERVLGCASAPQDRPAAERPAPPAPAAPATSTAAPQQTLVLGHGGKDYRFSPGVAEIVIGRSMENAIPLGSKFVSRSHARIAWPAGGAPRLKNLSRTGTSLKPDGAASGMKCVEEVELRGSGNIGLSENYADAETNGDVLRYSVIAVA